MSTKDIISIFSAYIPSHLEWINDSSCNIVWKDGDDYSVRFVLCAMLLLQLCVAHYSRRCYPSACPLFFFHLYICQHTQSQELCYLVLIDGIIHAAMPRTAGQACFVYARQGDWAGCVDAVIKKDCTGYQEEGANGKLFRRLHVRLSYHNLSLAC